MEEENSQNIERFKKIELLKQKIVGHEEIGIYPPRFHVRILCNQKAAEQSKDLNFNIEVMNADPPIKFHVVMVTGIEYYRTSYTIINNGMQ